MFCSQCGSQISDDSIFCRNCGAKIGQVPAPAQPATQPQAVQPQPQVIVQPQPQVVMQPQPGVQPQVVVQPQPGVQPQVVVQPQPGVQPQVVVQPQPGVQPQYYAQQVPVQQVVMQPQPGVQPQVVMQPQQAVQPQAAVQPQPGVQPQQAVQPQAAEPVQEKTKKKKNFVGLIIGLAAAFIVIIVGLVVFIINSGILKSPKRQFAENVVGVSQNINSKIPDVGMNAVDALFHLGVDDTKDTHTTTKTTNITSDMSPDMDLTLIQNYCYDKDSGNAGYDLTVNLNGSPMGTSEIYFDGYEFYFVPMKADAGMVRYEMDGAVADSMKNRGAIERYSLMVMGQGALGETDWDEALREFSEEALEDLEKGDFVKAPADYEILGEVKECKTVGVHVEGSQAGNLLRGVDKLIYRGYGESEDDSSMVFGKIVDEYERNGGNMEVNMTTYSYKKTPVAILLDVNVNGSPYSYEISYYEKKGENQLIFNGTSPDGKQSVYEESVISTGIGKYKMTTNVDFGTSKVYIEKEGHMLGNTKEINGTIEIVTGNEAGSAVSSAAGNSITGTISEMMLAGNGEKTTVLENEKGSITIETACTRATTANLSAPAFIPGSGIDCGDNLDALKSEVGITGKEDAAKVDSNLVHLAQTYILMLRKAGLSL